MTQIDWSSIPGCLTGAFVNPPWQGVQHHPAEREIQAFEQKIHKKLAVLMTFQAWGTPEKMAPFPEPWSSMVSRRGSLPMITWEPWDQRVECQDYLLEKISRGQWDGYLRSWADAIRKWGKPILIRWAHEMNGAWYPWDGLHNSNDPNLYVKAYRYIVSLFKNHKAINVQWVWSPEVVLHLARQGGVHDYTLYYPGDDFVDWIGLDGYNLGTVPGRVEPWRSFEEIFSEAFQRLHKLTQAKPVMIAEFACGEGGGSKPQWIQGAFKRMFHYPYLKAWIWFNIQKEADWTVDSSPASLASFKQAVADRYFFSGLP